MIKHKSHILSVILMITTLSCTLSSCGGGGGGDDDGGGSGSTVSSDYIRCESEITIGGNESSGTFSISANCNWRITGAPDWVTVNPTSGNGSQQVKVMVSANPSAVDERKATLTISSGGGISRTIVIKQSPASEVLTVDDANKNLEILSGGGSYTFAVHSNTRWTITGGTDWCTLSKNSGTGNEEVGITVSPNTTEYDRTATLTIRGKSTNVAVTVLQKGEMRTLSLSPENITATAVSGTYSLTLSGNADWTLSSDAAWATPDKMSGKGNSTIIITCADNTAQSSRKAVVTVRKTNGDPMTCTITQSAAQLPVVNACTVSNKSKYTADVSSSYSSEFPVTSYGFCYSATNSAPTVSDSKVNYTGDSKSGTITSTLTGLTSGTKYYVRAYATSVVGTSYGTVLSFTTTGTVPGTDDNPRPSY